jgi:hypothetical protein
MTVRVIRASSEDEMVAVFLRGELLSTRFGETVRAALAQAGAEEDIVLKPDLENERENVLRREVLDTARGFGRWEWLFGDFPDDVHWECVALAPAEVLAIEYISFDYWVELSGGSRKPTDAARRIRDGVIVFGVPNDGYLAAADRLADSMPPPLIVVGGIGRRLVLLEGHVRLTALALRPDALPSELEVMLGHSPRIGEWTYW